jgi:acetyl esterase/lipase
MRPTTPLAWLLLLLALGCALASCGSLMTPPRMNTLGAQSLVGVFFSVGENGYRLVLWPVGFAAAAWLLRRRHPLLSPLTVSLSALAIVLALRPIAQAWKLSRILPAQINAAFPSSTPDRAPFSFAALFASPPASVPIEELSFRSPLKLDFYRAVGRSPAPCIVSLHGGGWYGGSHRERRPVDNWLARKGYAVATIDYTLIPWGRWPQPRQDLLDAIAFLRTRAASLGIDPNQIVILGHSAGAQIAEATAFAGYDPGIRGVIACYAPTDLRDDWREAEGWDAKWLGGRTARQTLALYLGGSPGEAGAAYDSASGLFLAKAGNPPTLIIQGGVDPLVTVRETRELAAKLAAAGVPHALVEIPWAGHHFDLANFDGPGAQLANYSIERFLAAVTH